MPAKRLASPAARFAIGASWRRRSASARVGKGDAPAAAGGGEEGPLLGDGAAAGVLEAEPAPGRKCGREEKYSSSTPKKALRSAGGRPAKTAAGMVWMRATQVD